MYFKTLFANLLKQHCYSLKLLEYERHLFLLGHYIKTEPSIDINACAVLQIYKMFIVVKIVALFVVSKVVIYNVVCLQDWEG